MEDMRTMLLTELIDKMHSRMADKMFPPDPSKDDQPAATGIPESEAEEAEEEVDVDKDAVEMEPSDEELDEMLKD
jgi:hypothetical protein